MNKDRGKKEEKLVPATTNPGKQRWEPSGKWGLVRPVSVGGRGKRRPLRRPMTSTLASGAERTLETI